MQLALGHLGWTPAVFWEASLDELTTALEGYRQRQQQEDLRFGKLMALYLNVHRDEQKHPEPFTPLDFFPSLADLDGVPQQQEEDEAGGMELTPEVFALLNRDLNSPPQQPGPEGEGT